MTRDLFNKIGMTLMLAGICACSTVHATGDAVESVGQGTGHAVAGVGEAIGDAGQAVGEGAGELISGTGKAIKKGADRTERKGY